MVKFIFAGITAILFILACGPVAETNTNRKSPQFPTSKLDSSRHNKYYWIQNYQPKDNMVNRIQVPEGYTRVSVTKNSFADWLRHLPLKEPGAKVKLYNGELKSNQQVHEAIIDIDAGGNEDLQQCADACMRLKAEYHYSRNESSNIHFKFTSGDNASWNQWKKGYRPSIKGNKVTWILNAKADSSYKNFKSYMKTVFRYAGTQSLSQEMKTISKDQIQAGDVFIKGGFPGHAVMVMDVAENSKTKEKIFLIAQSYMPAQEIHILKNLENTTMSPWYTSDFTDQLNTPEWTFYGQCLKRFP